MKRINMTKYGFERWPEQDFTDDGVKFTCYKVGNHVRVSKTTYQGEAFIDGHIELYQLPYETYSKLPHYSSISALNGVMISDLTDEDLVQLYNDCLAYEQEYLDAVANFNYPSREEIEVQYDKSLKAAQAAYAEASELVTKNLDNIVKDGSNTVIVQIFRYLEQLRSNISSFEKKENIDNILNTAYSVQFCNEEADETPWQLTYLKELLQRLESEGYR